MVEAALLYYGRKKILDNTPIPLSLEKDNDPRLFTSPLKFPGKLAVDIENNRLFISDSNHNRIVGSLSLPHSHPVPLFGTLLHFMCFFSFLFLAHQLLYVSDLDCYSAYSICHAHNACMVFKPYI